MAKTTDEPSSLALMCQALGATDASQVAQLFLESRWPINRGHVLAVATTGIGSAGAALAKGYSPWLFWPYALLGACGAFGCLCLLVCEFGLRRISRIPEIRERIESHDRERTLQRGRRWTELSSRLLPARVADEELGDLLERMELMARRGESSWRCGATLIGGGVLVVINAVRDRIART